MRATGYKLIAPPMVAAGSTATLTAILAGGTDLDEALVITPTARSVTFPGPITITPGETSGTVIFVPEPLPTPEPPFDWTMFPPPDADWGRRISATHVGGNSGMADPYGWFALVSPGYPPATGFDWAIHPPPTPSQGPTISAWLTGGWVTDEELNLYFSDDLGSPFAGNPICLGRRFGTGLQDGPESGYVAYLPGGAGTRTIRATAIGGNPGMVGPSTMTLEVSSEQVQGPSMWKPVGVPACPGFRSFVVPSFTPAYPASSDYTVCLMNTPPGYPAQSDPVAIVAPVDVAQVVFLRLSGGLALDAPLVLTLSDDAGGLFPDGPITISGNEPGPGRQFAFATYIPTTPGLRTVSAAAVGGNPGMAGSIRTSGARLLAT